MLDQNMNGIKGHKLCLVNNALSLGAGMWFVLFTYFISMESNESENEISERTTNEKMVLSLFLFKANTLSLRYIVLL